jgi:Tfp pilus assembly protein PilF
MNVFGVYPSVYRGVWFPLIGLLLFSGCATGAKAQRVKTAQAHYKLGVSYLNDNSVQLAFVEFQKAVEANPDDRDSHYALGHIFFTQQRFDQAEESFRKALQISWIKRLFHVPSDFSEAHNYLGKVLEQKGRWEDAIVEYRLALKNPKYLTPHLPYYNLGNAYMKISAREEALKAFGDAVRVTVSPNDPTFVVQTYSYHGMGQVYDQMGKTKEAIEAYRKALQLTPNYAESHYHLGLAYLNDGEKSLAKQEFEKVLKLVKEGELAQNSKRYLEQLARGGS